MIIRWPAILAFITLIVCVIFFYYDQKKYISSSDGAEFTQNSLLKSANQLKSGTNQMGHQQPPPAIISVSSSLPHKNAEQEDQIIFSLIITDMIDCLSLPSTQPPESVPLKSNQVLNILSENFGLQTIEEKFRSWKFKDLDGSEKTLNLALLKDQSGEQKREIILSGVDENHQNMTLIPLEVNMKSNPTDETINNFLANKQNTKKDKESIAIYKNGETAIIVESDGVLQEMEIRKDKTLFRCLSLKTRDSCECFRQ
jgi:hypothetical protein